MNAARPIEDVAPATAAYRPPTRSTWVFAALVAVAVLVAAMSLLRPETLPAGAPREAIEQRDGEAEAAWADAASTDAALKVAEPMSAATELDADTLSLAAGDAAVHSDDAAAAGPTAAVDGALIVRTASLELEVADVAAALRGARAEMTALGGYVSASDELDQGESRWASVTYRVPVASFGEAIDALRGLADRVVRETTQSNEVTAAVVDLDARIANLRASEGALVAIMDRAGRIDDVLSVQLRLEDVRGQIERLEAERASLADRAALSTLTVGWFTPVAAVAVAQQGWDPAEEVDAALAQTVQALQSLASMGIWLGVVVLPLVVLPLLLLLLLAVLLRRRNAHRGSSSAALS